PREEHPINAPLALGASHQCQQCAAMRKESRHDDMREVAFTRRCSMRDGHYSKDNNKGGALLCCAIAGRHQGVSNDKNVPPTSTMKRNFKSQVKFIKEQGKPKSTTINTLLFSCSSQVWKLKVFK
ncbi:hypothetical protein HAX54_027646, partial [Datura stramonium]|nr:hypothetical protein [Datura stramonium]